MSRHEGVSCDACMKANFRGRRYKCLICYDYDLCATCYENSAVTNQHSSEHAMQCILTRHDFDIFHGGESLSSNQPQSLTCPFCGKMGHTEATLKDHVAANHPCSSSVQVVCPICASIFGGDPNHITDDFAGHLAIDHQSGAPRDLDAPENSSRHNVRRVSQQSRNFGRGASRPNMRFGDSMDPIAELLSHLSGVRRPPGGDLSSAWQYEQQSTLRQHMRRGGPTRRYGTSSITSGAGTAVNGSVVYSAASGNTAMKVVTGGSTNVTASAPPQPQQSTQQNNKSSDQQSQFLLSRIGDLEKEQDRKDSVEVRQRSEFVQELLLSTLSLSPEELQAACEVSLNGASAVPATANVSTQTSPPANSSIVSSVQLPSPTCGKQPTKQPAPKSQKYNYLASNPSQPLVRNLSSNISLSTSQGNGRPPPPSDVNSVNKKKPSRGPDGRTSQPPH